MKLLTKEQQKSYENAKSCFICREEYEYEHAKDKKHLKLETIVIIQVNIEVLYIAYVIYVSSLNFTCKFSIYINKLL